jgi:hypothetical protein
MTFVDPIAMYMAGYRYNQPTHLSHMFIMCHAFAYFTFDSIIEIIYGTDDLLTNLHHVIVLISNYCHMKGQYGGFEYLVMHWLAEVSNPSLILRTIWKLTNKTNTWYYHLNDRIFAGIFIVVRMLLAPVTLLWVFEGDNVLFTCKVGYVFIILISFLWGSTILYNIALALKSAFDVQETKDKGQVPAIV